MRQHYFIFVFLAFSFSLYGANHSSCMPRKKAKKQSRETKESTQLTQSCMQPVPATIQVRKKQSDTLQQLMIDIPFITDPNPAYTHRKNKLLTFLDENERLAPGLRLPLDYRTNANVIFTHYCAHNRCKRYTRDKMPYIPPLKAAVLFFDMDIVRRMITLKADVNHPDEHGNTPFMYAHNGPMMQTLIDAGANVYAQNKEGHDILGVYNCRDEERHGDGENEARCIATMVHIVFHAILQDTFGNIPLITHLIGDYVHAKIMEPENDPEINEVHIRKEPAHREINYKNIEPYLEPLETFAHNRGSQAS